MKSLWDFQFVAVASALPVGRRAIQCSFGLKFLSNRCENTPVGLRKHQKKFSLLRRANVDRLPVAVDYQHDCFVQNIVHIIFS